MRCIFSLLLWTILTCNMLSAEGTRQLAPNATININGNITTDIAALHINNPAYNNFAAYTNPNPQSRLYIHLKDPSTECIYLGFNWAHNNEGTPFPTRISFEYRIKDPNGNIVYGPVTVTPGGAHIQNWSQGWIGPVQIHGPGGYNATHVTSTDLQSQGWTEAGDYYIEFRDFENNDLLIDFWDITVADCSTPTPTEKAGRVWSYNWAIFSINDFGFPNRPFNGAFFVCAPDPDNPHTSFVTKIDFNGSGFRPAAFNVAFNSYGIFNTGNITEDRKSVEDLNATQSEYAIFLNDPLDICETAEVGDITLLGISRCPGELFCIKFTATKTGQIDLLLDFDGGDNIYTPGTADIMVTYTIDPSQVNVPSCILWDGLDGLGNALPEDISTQIPITFTYAQGIYHFPIYDAEYLTEGFTIQSVRPAASISLLFYDDSQISVPSGSGEPTVQLAGCMTPCHRWTNYTNPDAIGFGNRNTINSWWFSQLIVRQDIFFLPSYYTCDIEGPSRFCEGGTAELSVNAIVSPEGAAGSEIISTLWTGPGISGPATGSVITIDDEGTYTVTVQWRTELGDTCQTDCSFDVTLDPPLASSIDTLMLLGETITINGQTYTQGGQYMQQLTTSAGCDSLLTINIVVLNTVIHYDLNACESFMSNGTNMDYSEFVASYPQPLACAEITADNLHRNNPQMNKHSCTPGVSDSPGMCVGALDGCTFQAGDDASVVIEIHIVPDADTAVHVTGFSFYEKAPLTYEWISGTSGPNNYPTLFGLRILKNGVEIFRDEAIPTADAWNLRSFDFFGNEEFRVKDPSTFRFELLPYCPVGNGAVESVWDLDEISILAGCASVDGLNKSIAGTIMTEYGLPIPQVKVHLYETSSLLQEIATSTNGLGQYIFQNLLPEEDYYLKAFKNDDFLNGVTTLDLIYLQKHLLGIQRFESPYQFIAADANNSESLSVLDLVELRKLILGKYTELPRNTSWRFGIAGEILDIQNPWSMRETYAIEYLGQHVTDAHFVGIKIGDVNGDAEFLTSNSTLNSRGYHPTILHIKETKLEEGKPLIVDILADDVMDLTGIQMALGLEGGMITGIHSALLNLGHDHFLLSPDGSLRLSWNDANLVNIQSGDVLFSLELLPGKNGYVHNLLQINANGLRAEAYVGPHLETVDIEFRPLWNVDKPTGNYLYPNTPNPFSESTTIRFFLDEAGVASIRISDLNGRLIFEKTAYFEKGMNALEMTSAQLRNATGILNCQLQGEGFIASQKMILLY